MAKMTFECESCRKSLSAELDQVGTLFRCPLCNTTQRVPEPATVGVGAASDEIGLGPRVKSPPPTPRHIPGRAVSQRRFGFNCPYCSSRLEATQARSAEEGQCPTCGNTIVIPILDRYNRLIDPITQKVVKQDPHPVHAYAAAGDRAPNILRLADGSQIIECPRCRKINPVSANNCQGCGLPFTMDGTTLEATGTTNGYCVASLVLGIIGLPASCLVIPSVLAIIFGVIGYLQSNQPNSDSGGKGMAIVGFICGIVGVILGVMIMMR